MNLLRKTNYFKKDNQNLDTNYMNYLYHKYLYGSNLLEYAIEIDENDFYKIIYIISDILKLRLTEEQLKEVMDHYVTLLIADAADGKKVDIRWFINHIWYLNMGTFNKEYKKNYDNCSILIQDTLIKEFNIKENLKETISRKIYTRCLSK